MKALVLVVDDEPTIVSTVCAILEGCGFRTEGATSGKEAVAKAAVSRPDLMLSDVLMPGMNGFETGLEIKKLCPDCHLLFFTAYGDVSALSAALRSTGHDFEVLAKPMRASLLVDRIKAMLEAG